MRLNQVQERKQGMVVNKAKTWEVKGGGSEYQGYSWFYSESESSHEKDLVQLAM